MNKSQIAVGTRVCERRERWSRHEPKPCGGVITKVGNPNVLVKWDDSWRNQPGDEFAIKDLVLESEKVEEFSKLEAEWQLQATPIREKLKQAGELLREANKLAEDAGTSGLHELDELYELTRVMDDLGWATSSLHC